MMDTVGKKNARDRDRGDQGRGRAGRDRRHRPGHPTVRRRGCHRRLAARVDVRARAHAAPRRRSRRGAPPPDRTQRARQVRRACARPGSERSRDEGSDRLRARQPAAAVGRVARRAGRRPRTQRLRLAVAVGAHQRTRRPTPSSRSRTRPRGPRRSSSARACRCCPAAVPRSSPRSGRRSTCSPAVARCPRSGSASCIPSSNRRSAWSAPTVPRSSTKRSRCSGDSGPRTTSTTTAGGSTTST